MLPCQWMRLPPWWQVRHTWFCASAGPCLPNRCGTGFLVGPFRCSVASPWQAWQSRPVPNGVRASPRTACFVYARPSQASLWHFTQIGSGSSAGLSPDGLSLGGFSDDSAGGFSGACAKVGTDRTATAPAHSHAMASESLGRIAIPPSCAPRSEARERRCVWGGGPGSSASDRRYCCSAAVLTGLGTALVRSGPGRGLLY